MLVTDNACKMITPPSALCRPSFRKRSRGRKLRRRRPYLPSRCAGKQREGHRTIRGGGTQQDGGTFAFSYLTWEEQRNQDRRAYNLRVINTLKPHPY